MTMKNIADNEFEIRTQEAESINSSTLSHQWYYMIKYLLVGFVFGIVFVKTEIISWFRIQEMFRLQSFHMYGVIGTAVTVGMVSIWLLKKMKVKTIHGEAINFPTKTWNKGQVWGGLCFGLGWAITGACPGPLFAQIGTGALVIIVPLLSAIAGTWFYGLIRHKLPH